MGSYECSVITLDEGSYRQDSMETLADMFDIAINVRGLSCKEATDAFVASGFAEQFERRNPVFVAGKSGSELVDRLLPYVGLGAPPCQPSDSGALPITGRDGCLRISRWKQGSAGEVDALKTRGIHWE